MRLPPISKADEELAVLFSSTWDRLREAPAELRLAMVMGVVRRAISRTARPRHVRDVVDTAAREAAMLRPVVERFAVADGMTYEDLISDSGRRVFSRTRARCWWAMSRCLKVPDRSCGAAIGGRDRTTVIGAVKVVDAEVAADPALGDRLRRLAFGEPSLVVADERKSTRRAA